MFYMPLQKYCKVIFILIVAFEIFSVNVSYCQLTPKKASYTVIIDPNQNEAEIVYTIMVNNSHNYRVYFPMTLTHWIVKEIVGDVEFVAIMKEELLQNVTPNIKAYRFDNGTKINGTIKNFYLDGYSSAFFSLRYKIRDVLYVKSWGNQSVNSLDLSLTLDAEDATFIVKIPKHNNPFGLDYLQFYVIDPFPSEVSEDGDFIMLIWRDPPQILDDGKLHFNPAILFNYQLNQSLLISLTITFIIALFSEKIIIKLLQKLNQRYKITEKIAKLFHNG